MSNATLWPLYHDVVAKPEFHREWWEAYVQVNQRFADAAVEAAAKDGVVWVHDYQLQLVPADGASSAARPADRLLPAHPVPAVGAVQAAALARLDPRGSARRRPGRLPAARRRGELRPAGAGPARATRRTATGSASRTAGPSSARAYPISIDVTSFEKLAASPEVEARAAEIRADLGDPTLGPARCRPARLHQGHPATAACVRRADRRGPVSASRRRSSSRSRHRAANGSTSTRRSATTSSAGSAGSTATSAGSAARRCSICTRPTPVTEMAALVPRRRRDGRDPVRRRHEPGRQGVRHVPARQHRRACAVGVRRRLRRAQAGLPGQPARHQRRSGGDAGRRCTRRPARRPGGCGRCASRYASTTSTPGPRASSTIWPPTTSVTGRAIELSSDVLSLSRHHGSRQPDRRAAGNSPTRRLRCTNRGVRFATVLTQIRSPVGRPPARGPDKGEGPAKYEFAEPSFVPAVTLRNDQPSDRSSRVRHHAAPASCPAWRR